MNYKKVSNQSIEIMQSIPENHAVQIHYDQMYYLEDQQRHHVHASRWSKNNLYKNIIDMEKLLMEALSIEN